MRPRHTLATLVSISALLLMAGCATVSKGRSQKITVRSVPSGAVASINGTTVGRTPLRVALPRGDVYRIELTREGFNSTSALIMPVPNEFEKNTFRWGLDYASGAMTDLSPDELTISLTPTIDPSASGDRYANMAAAVQRADAMLASGQLNRADHDAVVSAIVARYSN